MSAQHENFTLEEWRLEVANGETESGYDDWVQHQLTMMLAVDDEEPQVKTFDCSISCFEDALDHEAAAWQFWAAIKRTHVPPTITVFPDDDDSDVLDFQFDKGLPGDWIVEMREEYIDIQRVGRPGVITIKAESEGFVVDVWDEQPTSELQATTFALYSDLGGSDE